MKIKIKGTGSAVPKLRVTNDDLSKLMDTSDEWIRSRTGIGARHLAVEETTTGLAVAAAKEALKDAEMTAEELDLIIAATVTADKFLPNLSCEVQSALGAKNAVAFDLNAACSGFLFALNTVQMYLENGVYKKTLVIGAETLSKIMDWNDRSTCVLFGDGAGAAVVEVDSETNCKAKQPGAANKSGILSMIQGSDGARGEVLRCDNRPVNNPFAVNDTKLSYVSMNGQEVYKFAVKTVPKVIEEAVKKAGLEVEDIDPRIYTTTVKEFKKDKKGNLTSVVTVKLESKTDEKTGRRMMVPVEGTEAELPCELVLIAAGFLGSQKYVTDAFGVELTERTNVKTAADGFETSVPGVFTAGDMHTGQSLVVKAIRQGRDCARAVDFYLMGYTNL